jgi:hypothetical protein
MPWCTIRAFIYGTRQLMVVVITRLASIRLHLGAVRPVVSIHVGLRQGSDD